MCVCVCVCVCECVCVCVCVWCVRDRREGKINSLPQTPIGFFFLSVVCRDEKGKAETERNASAYCFETSVCVCVCLCVYVCMRACVRVCV